MSDFSDRPFVAGALTGLRAFRVDSLGRLTGITYKDVWTPGENVAQCHANSAGVASSQFAVMAQQMATITAQLEARQSQRGYGRRGQKSTAIPQIPTPREKAAEVVKVHHIAGIACQCGFYAYFDGGNDYLTDSGGGFTVSMYGGLFATGAEDRAPRVGAIVNAWGAATVGTRGFRAEKAEIVALIVPASTAARHEVAFSKAQRNYPDVQVFETEKDAVRAFPLTDAAPYTPETDPDFWTRSAS